MKTKHSIIAVLLSSLLPQLAQAQIVVGPVSPQQVPLSSPWMIMALTFGLVSLGVKFRHKLARKGSLLGVAIAAVGISQVDWINQVNAASGSTETVTSSATQTIDIVGVITIVENRSGANLEVKSMNLVIDDGSNPPAACSQDSSSMLPPGEHHCAVGFIIPDGEECRLECRP